MFQLIAIVALVAVLIGGAEMWKYKAIQADRAERQVKEQQEQLLAIRIESEQRQKVIDYADELSKTRAAEAKQNAARLAAIESRMRELLERDPKVAAWASADVPDAVRRLRRDEPANGEKIGSLRNPGEGIDANPDAAVERQNEQRPVNGSKPMPGGVIERKQEQSRRVENSDAAKSTPNAILERIGNLKKGLSK
jgi:hypothetical protein